MSTIVDSSDLTLYKITYIAYDISDKGKVLGDRFDIY